jgi:hypothetical protein
MTAPSDVRMIKFRELSSVASPLMFSDDGKFFGALKFAIQSSWPSVLDRTRLDLPVRASVVDEGSVIGVARLATHTTLSLGMLLYHMPT